MYHQIIGSLCLSFLIIGCIKQPVIEKPIDILIVGKGDRAEPQPISYPDSPEMTVDWTIEVFDRDSHKNWRVVNPSFEDTLVVMNTDDWECTALKTHAINFYELVTVNCRNKNSGFWDTITTRAVGCGELSRDSADTEREKISIYIICEKRLKF